MIHIYFGRKFPGDLNVRTKVDLMYRPSIFYVFISIAVVE